MINATKIEDLIRKSVILSGPDSRGFYSLKCLACSDYKVRAGFKFDNGQIGFNCWNCGRTGRYEELSGRMSSKFKDILVSHGVSADEIDTAVNSSFFSDSSKSQNISLKSLCDVSIDTPVIKLPYKCFRLGSPGFEDYQTKLIDYLIKRKVDLLKYPFFFSLEPRFLNRVIIPFYKSGKIIYWQARSIDDTEKKRYDNAPVSKDAVIFNYDKIHIPTKMPLIVSEGVFDAMMLDGIAILGSKLSTAKEKILKSCKRELLFVIDKDKVGKNLGLKALENGWKITFLPDGINDVNDGVRKIGALATAYYLRRNIPINNDEAHLLLNIYCTKDSLNGN